MICKYCASESLVKYGKTSNLKQIFRCKDCKKYFRIGDGRVKYDEKIKEMAFILYTEGNGFRRIARILSKIFGKKIYYQTVVKWLRIRHSSLKIEENIAEEIEVLEVDELFTYIKKNEIQCEYGLVLTATKCVCVHFKWVILRFPLG